MWPPLESRLCNIAVCQPYHAFGRACCRLAGSQAWRPCIWVQSTRSAVLRACATLGACSSWSCNCARSRAACRSSLRSRCWESCSRRGDGIAASLDDALRGLRLLSTLILTQIPAAAGVPPSLAALGQLTTLRLGYTADPAGALRPSLQLPMGAVQRSLQILLIDSRLAACSLDFLRGAGQLKRIVFLDTHVDQSAQALGQHKAFWLWARRHASLEVMAIPVSGTAVPTALVIALLLLAMHRPQVQIVAATLAEVARFRQYAHIAMD